MDISEPEELRWLVADLMRSPYFIPGSPDDLSGNTLSYGAHLLEDCVADEAPGRWFHFCSGIKKPDEPYPTLIGRGVARIKAARLRRGRWEILGIVSGEGTWRVYTVEGFKRRLRIPD